MAQTPFRNVPEQEIHPAKEVEVVEPTIDVSAVDQLDPIEVEKPIQVEDTVVVYYPLKDFEGRVNDNKYEAKKGVPVKIPRDVANIWLEDESRGYVREN